MTVNLYQRSTDMVKKSVREVVNDQEDQGKVAKLVKNTDANQKAAVPNGNLSDEDLGRELRHLRDDLGLSWAKVAAHFNWSPKKAQQHYLALVNPHANLTDQAKTENAVAKGRERARAKAKKATPAKATAKKTAPKGKPEIVFPATPGQFASMSDDEKAEALTELRDNQRLSWRKVGDVIFPPSPTGGSQAAKVRRLYSKLVRPHTESLPFGKPVGRPTGTGRSKYLDLTFNPVDLTGMTAAQVKGLLVGKVVQVRPEKDDGTVRYIEVTELAYRKGAKTITLNGEQFPAVRIAGETTAT